MRPKEILNPGVKIVVGLAILAFAISSCGLKNPVIGVEVDPANICGRSFSAETVIVPGSNAVIGEFSAPVLPDGNLDLRGNKRVAGFNPDTGSLSVSIGDVNGDGLSDTADINGNQVMVKCGR